MDKPATESSLMEIPVPEVTPPTEAAETKHVGTAEPASNETPQGEAAEFDIATSTSSGKNPKF